MVLASAPINWCRNSKRFGGIRAVSSEPKTSGSNMPFHVTLIKNMTPDATIPASRPARKPTLNGLFLRKNAIFMRRYFQNDTCLRHVMLSEAKHLTVQRARFFASLRMTIDDFIPYSHTIVCYIL